MFKKESPNIDQAVQLLKSGQKKAQDIICRVFDKACQPKKDKPGKGPIWAGRHLGDTFLAKFQDSKLPLQAQANKLLHSPKKELRILGLFILAEYGRFKPKTVFKDFRKYSKDGELQVRTAAAIAFRRVLEKNKKEALLFLKLLAIDINADTRRFVCEVLRPVGDSRWILKQPEKSLSALRLLMWDGDMGVKKALSSNLNILSKRDPALIYQFLAQQLRVGNLHTYWIAYRSVKELVKQQKYRKKVLKLLKIDEYSHKGKVYR
ncbi:DNA alkylation repair protein [Candidatus Margulisiibacteriota bacterium]